MKTFIIFLFFISSSLSRPESGYSYNAPNFQQDYFADNSQDYNPDLVQIQKHIYFYTAPEYNDEQQVKIVVPPAGRKSTKIIFIKAPSYGPIIPQIVTSPSQVSDKTIVYILVKKAENPPPITIPTSTVVKDTKPEVYFIKYKTQHDAQASIQHTLNGNPVGENAQPLNSGQNFISTLNGNAVVENAQPLNNGQTFINSLSDSRKYLENRKDPDIDLRSLK